MEKTETKKGLTGGALKWIALVTMLIDHIGAAQVAPVVKFGSMPYEACRLIGRISFPLFCFLLVEGFCHTRDCHRYRKRLFLFALLSEIPFDLAFYGNIVSLQQQNVFFTLWLGLCALQGVKYFQDNSYRLPWGDKLFLIPIFLCVVTAWALRTDYDGFGVLLIVVMYLFRDSIRWFRNLAIGVMCVWEPPSLLALLPIQFYNRERGWQPKYLFYMFYPVHLVLLWIIRTGLTG